MKDFNSISEQYVKHLQHYEQLKAEIEHKFDLKKREIDRLEEDVKRLHHPSWIDELIEPIAKLMVERMPDRYYEILGPFGLSAEVSIHFDRKGVDEKHRFDGDNCLSITFRPNDLNKGEICLVDHTVNTGQYREGTIGEMNGGNYQTKPMLNTVDELMDWLNKQNEKR